MSSTGSGGKTQFLALIFKQTPERRADCPLRTDTRHLLDFRRMHSPSIGVS